MAAVGGVHEGARVAVVAQARRVHLERRVDARQQVEVVAAQVGVELGRAVAHVELVEERGGERIGVDDHDAVGVARGAILVPVLALGDDLEVGRRPHVAQPVGQRLGVVAAVLGHPDGRERVGEVARDGRLAGALGAEHAHAPHDRRARAAGELVEGGQRVGAHDLAVDAGEALDLDVARRERGGPAVVAGAGEADVGRRAEAGAHGRGRIVARGHRVHLHLRVLGERVADPAGAQLGRELVVRLVHDDDVERVHEAAGAFDEMLVPAVERCEPSGRHAARLGARHGRNDARCAARAPSARTW